MRGLSEWSISINSLVVDVGGSLKEKLPVTMSRDQSECEQHFLARECQGIYN